MALLEMKVLGDYYGKAWVTTFHYTTTTTPAVVTQSFALAAAAGFVQGFTPVANDMYADWKAAVINVCYFREIQVRNVYSVSDFYTQPLSVNNAGGQTGQAAASSQAYAVQSSRVRQDIRRGNRRLQGVNTDSLNNDGELGPGQLTLMEALAASMTATLTYDDEGNSLSFTPVIVSKERYTTPAGNYAYRYYQDVSDQLAHTASGILWKPAERTTTQVSRKPGRGI